MAIVRWGPARDLLSMREAMDRLLNDAFPGYERRSAGWGDGSVEMPLDVYQTDREYVVKAALPGVKPEQIEVNVIRDTLSIKARAEMDREVKEEDWLLRERRYNSFSRTITLPTELQSDRVEATMESGILTLKLPKSDAVLPRSIKVQAR